ADQAWTQTTSPAVARERVTYGEPTPELRRPRAARQRNHCCVPEGCASRRAAGPAAVAGAVSGVSRRVGVLLRRPGPIRPPGGAPASRAATALPGRGDPGACGHRD